MCAQSFVALRRIQLPSNDEGLLFPSVGVFNASDRWLYELRLRLTYLLTY